MTDAELDALLNSAYIYLPFISSMKQEVDGDNVTVSLEGGLIWWQVKVAGDGTTSVEQILTATTSGVSSLDRTSKNPLTKKPMYREFKFGDDKWSTKSIPEKKIASV